MRVPTLEGKMPWVEEYVVLQQDGAGPHTDVGMRRKLNLAGK